MEICAKRSLPSKPAQGATWPDARDAAKDIITVLLERNDVEHVLPIYIDICLVEI